MNVIRIKRIYEPWDEADGHRILADRLWPRGVSKQAAALDEWAKDFAPSTELRKALHQGDMPDMAFESAYRMELAANPGFRRWATSLRTVLEAKNITLLTATALGPLGHAEILKAAIEENR